MGRNIGGHADCDAGGAVDQKIGESCRQDGGFFLRFIEVGNKIDRILAYIRQHLHGDLGQPRLCITHGRGAVAVHGTEVAVSVHQGIAHGPGLGHVDQGSVNGTVAVGMIFTHGIADDTGALSVGLVRTVVQFAHGVEDSSLYRL